MLFRVLIVCGCTCHHDNCVRLFFFWHTLLSLNIVPCLLLYYPMPVSITLTAYYYQRPGKWCTRVSLHTFRVILLSLSLRTHTRHRSLYKYTYTQTNTHTHNSSLPTPTPTPPHIPSPPPTPTHPPTQVCITSRWSLRPRTALSAGPVAGPVYVVGGGGGGVLSLADRALRTS